MHTTKEAKSLWCPMVRIGVLPSHGGPAGVSDPTTEFHGNCIADGCAMWRWDGDAKLPLPREQLTWWPREDFPEVEPQRHPNVPTSAVWIPLTREGENFAGGYWEEPQEKVDVENEQAREQARATMRGYCGLAGAGVR